MTEVLAIISGIFKFWDETVWFIKLLQSTPEQDHAALVVKMQAEADTMKKTGRPVWD